MTLRATQRQQLMRAMLIVGYEMQWQECEMKNQNSREHSQSRVSRDSTRKTGYSWWGHEKEKTMLPCWDLRYVRKVCKNVDNTTRSSPLRWSDRSTIPKYFAQSPVANLGIWTKTAHLFRASLHSQLMFINALYRQISPISNRVAEIWKQDFSILG